MSREGKPMVNKPLIRVGYFRGGAVGWLAIFVCLSLKEVFGGEVFLWEVGGVQQKISGEWLAVFVLYTLLKKKS